MRLFLLTCLSFLFPFPCVTAQNRTLEIEDLQSWNRIRNTQVGADGKFVLYSLEPDVGDPTVVVYNVEKQTETRLERLHGARLTYDGRYVIGLLKPGRDTVRAYKLDERGKELKKMDSLLVLDPATGQRRVIAGVYGFTIGERWSDDYAYTTDSALPDSLTKDLDKDARRLVVRSFSERDSFFMEGVTDYVLARDAPVVLARRVAKDSTWDDGVFRLDTRQLEWQALSQGERKYAGLAVAPDGSRSAFLSTRKEDKRTQPPFHVHLHTGGADSASVISREPDWMPRGHRITDDYRPRFSPTGSYLYVGTTPRRPERDTNLLDEDIADVEVWTSQDARMYTQENVRLKEEKKRTYLAAYNLERQDWLQVATDDYPRVALSEETESPYVLVYDDRPYLKQTTWEGWPAARDMAVVNLDDGRVQEFAKAEKSSPEWSFGGQYITWYNPVDTAWKAYAPAIDETVVLTTPALGTFTDELNDRPMDPGPYGIEGWTDGDEAVILRDRYDLWTIDPARGASSAVRITQGREDEIRYRAVNLDRTTPLFSGDRRVYTAFNEKDKRSGFTVTEGLSPIAKRRGPYRFAGIRKARSADRFVYTREDFGEFPDLRVLVVDEADQRNADRDRRISNANPRQADFAWGTAEPYTWTDNQGRRLEGTLIKPPGFDSTRQYPMIVNFYERSSDNLYRHRAPYPHRSTINYSYYANRGYLIFNPDVIYRVGYPGESAYDCVMPGVLSLIDEGFVDKERIGLQGHSWGGYQVAYMATKTDMFACIESGAPVVNMFSAYGGIRWGSGLSRQFQYEKTQSRIGGTPWEYPLRYLENSPIFFTDKINTPILILHNDKDGAVPWYQGIEWFTALRRLDKPAWMLNYRGEPHWPLEPANRADFNRRMSQFFDHYLRGAPMPRWMREGVAPVERGIEQGYEAMGDSRLRDGTTDAPQD